MPDSATPVGARIAQVIDERLLPRRYVVLAVAGVLFWTLQLWLSDATGGDWHTFLINARSIGSVKYIGVYMGPAILLFAYPFTFVSATVGWVICSLLCLVLGLVSIRCLEEVAAASGFGNSVEWKRTSFFGGLFLLYAWSLPGAKYGHADDVIVLTCVAFVLRALVERRWLMASLLLALAIDTKPWAALALPLVAACSGRRLRGLVVTIVVAVTPVLPFLILHHGHLDVGYMNLGVAPDSAIHYLGVPVYATPAWPRDLQLALGICLGAFALSRGRWYLVPMIVFAVRINLDPETYSYYMTGPIFGAYVWDVVRPARLWGTRTAVACIALVLVPQNLQGADLYGNSEILVVIFLRLLVALVAIGALLDVPVPRFMREPQTP